MNILHQINGKNYVLISDYVRSEKGLIECQQRIKKYKCIFQGLQNATSGFWADKSCYINILVPEENIMAFNNEIIDLD